MVCTPLGGAVYSAYAQYPVFNPNSSEPWCSDGKESACNMGDLGSSLGWKDPLEKETVTHSNILAWRIPRIEEPGRLQSMGLQRVGCN